MAISSLEQILTLFQKRDFLAVALATGQPMGLMQALSKREDWEHLEIFCGLVPFPYPILQQPKVHVTSGYYGPIERYLNEAGANLSYLPANFTGFELFARKKKPRVIATTVSTPDKDGFVTFGTHAGAIAVPFCEALKNPKQVAIAEMNPRMPRVYGEPAMGDNKVLLSDITHVFEHETSPVELPTMTASSVEEQMANHVLELIKSGDTLQFGIGGVPDRIATLLAQSSLGDFGIHSELISDGFLKLFEAGKISNRHKGVFPGASVFTFAFGSQALYDFLDERNGRNHRTALCLPVSVVNDPSVIAKNPDMVSLNSALTIDFAGQVCSEAIGLRQYSGVGGQLSFVEGAYQAERGRSVICLKSTACVDGKLLSNIVPTLPPGSLVSTPRHFVQFVVTEYGVADLYGVCDENRAEKLIAIAHPSFRDELKDEAGRQKALYYKNK